MKSATIRFIIILSLLTAGGIIVLQAYWVRRALALEEREFNLNANTALRNAAYKVMELKENQAPVYSPVERMSADYYVAQTNVFIEQRVLEHILVEEFTKVGLLTDFEYGLYDCMSDTVQYAGYVHMAGSSDQHKPTLSFPKMHRENYYFSVHFPHRKQYLTSQLGLWIISTIILLCVLAFLGYLLFIIFRQKRLGEVQKDFVDNMTHEFKTPLATIQLSAEVLQHPDIGANPQRLLNYATIISAESVKLNAQVERVLQMAHARHDRMVLKKEPFVWQELITEVADSFKNLIQSQNGLLILQLPKTLIHYTGDILHLKNAISNLIDNAVKYCNGAPEITVSLTQGKGHIAVAVADNGIGISKQHQKMLFQRFYRVPTGNVHNVKGFGIGLNFVQIIAKAHGGTVHCDSQPGHGTTFTLRFPIDKTT